jgi:mannose/cellobiose epimerase-like protein (N-acyl-D-glucosamine 2-epimerase family)
LLLDAERSLGDAGCGADAARLFDWAVIHGLDRQHGGVFDEVAVDGRLVADTTRIWPLTEYIKARAARFAGSRQPQEVIELRAALDLLFSAYLLGDGGWRERLDRDLTCRDDALPATTCYHLVGSLLDARAALTGMPRS